MAIDKLNSLQFLFLRADYFQEFGDRDGVYVDRVPFELRQRLLRWTWPTTARNQYFFQDVISRAGREAFVRWVCRALDRQLGAEGEATGTIDGFIHALDGKAKSGTPVATTRHLPGSCTPSSSSRTAPSRNGCAHSMSVSSIAQPIQSLRRGRTIRRPTGWPLQWASFAPLERTRHDSANWHLFALHRNHPDRARSMRGRLRKRKIKHVKPIADSRY